MIYTYKELKEQGLSAYNIKRMLEEGFLYKIDKGLYSDSEVFDQMEYISRKYPDAILTGESAFYIWDLTDEIPDNFHFATSHNSLKINDENINQKFSSNKFLKLGVVQIQDNNATINVYDKERMLIELIRDKKKYPYSLYKEVIHNYRDIADEIDTYKLNEYLKSFRNGDRIMSVIMDEVF